MKLPITCFQCSKENPGDSYFFGPVEFRDNGRYEIICPNGHSTITLLQQQKFELLFDIGAYAIVDGYYREAVSSFTSSLERFYEFFIKVVCIAKDIEWGIISEAWKEVSNQSERQLGAFIFMYLQEFGKKPHMLSNNKVKFRNEVVHKGNIPNREQAHQYGQAVLDVVRPILSILKEDYGEAVRTATHHHLSNIRTQSDDGIIVSTTCLPTIISLTCDDQRTLEEGISQLRYW
jgi:hypothetical protein